MTRLAIAILMFSLPASTRAFGANCGSADLQAQITQKVQACKAQSGGDPAREQQCANDAQTQTEQGCMTDDGSGGVTGSSNSAAITAAEDANYNSDIKNEATEGISKWVQDCIAKCASCAQQCYAAQAVYGK